MTETQKNLLIAAGAAVAFWLPGTADPYQSPRLLALGGAALWLLTRPAGGRSSLEPYLLAGLGAWLVAAIAAKDATYAVVGSYLSPFDCLTAVLIYAALVIGAARTGAGVGAAAEAVVLAAIPVAAYAILQRAAGGADPLLPAPLPTMRSVATQGSPVYLGTVLAMAGACAAGIAPRRPRLALGAAVLILPAIACTGTRGAILGAAVAALWLIPRRLAILALVAVPAILLTGREGVFRADMGRFEVWRIAAGLFWDNPLTGIGPGNFYMTFRQAITPTFIMTHGGTTAVQAHAHNQLLHVLATTGVVGLAGYLAVAGGALRVLRNAALPDRPLLAAVVTAYAVPAMLNPVSHSATAVLALLFGCASSVQGGRIYASVTAWRGACVLSMALTSAIVLADMHYASAVYAIRSGHGIEAVREMENSATLNPFEPQFTARYLDGVLRLMNVVEPHERRILSERSVELAQKQLDRHPLDAWSHEMAGRSVLLAWANGLPYDPRHAARFYHQASELAPTFIPVLQERLRAAVLFKDQRGQREARARIAMLTAYTKGGI